jgi:hypothetical protein
MEPRPTSTALTSLLAALLISSTLQTQRAVQLLQQLQILGFCRRFHPIAMRRLSKSPISQLEMSPGKRGNA